MVEIITSNEPKQADPLKPELALLTRLGSIAVHAEEMLSEKGHAYDRVALQQLLQDSEVQQWITAMGVYMPVRRRPLQSHL